MCQVGLRRGLVDILADSTAEFVSSLVDAGSLPVTVKPCNGVTHTGAPTSWALCKLSSVEISGMLLHSSQSDVIWQLWSIAVPSSNSLLVALQQLHFFLLKFSALRCICCWIHALQFTTNPTLTLLLLS